MRYVVDGAASEHSSVMADGRYEGGKPVPVLRGAARVEGQVGARPMSVTAQVTVKDTLSLG